MNNNNELLLSSKRTSELKTNDLHVSAISGALPIHGMEPAVYNRYSTWVLIDKRGPQDVFRILLADEERLYLVKIGGMHGTKPVYLAPSKLASSRILMLRVEADRLYFAQRFRAIHDSFIPEKMEVGICTPDRMQKFEKKKEVVAFAKEQWGDFLLQNECIYAKAITSLAIQFSVSDVSVRRWLETNYFFREHPNALIDRTWEQGGREVTNPRSKQKSKPLARTLPGEVGRPPSSQRIGMNGDHKVIRLAPHIRARMESFIEREVWDTNDPFPYIYRRMLDECLVAYNRNSDGEIQKHKIGEDKLPRSKRLKEIGRKIYNKCLANVVEVTGNVRGLGYKKTGGTANDIVHDDLPIYDLDATVADNYLLYGDDIIKIDGCSKPTVVMAKDRSSKAIVGLYVTYRSESTEGYLGCLISAFLKKDWELKLWDASHLDGLVYGCPSSIFVDRGAGSSEEVTNKIVVNIRAHSIFAQPGVPQAKGSVENVMGKFQQVLARVISGSYFPSGDVDFDKVRKRYAEDGAIPVKVFMRALWEMVSQHNLSVDTGLEATPDMLKDPKFSANPRGLFNYYHRRRRGDIAWDWPLESIIRKLGIEHERKAPDGVITLDNREFSCSSFITYAKAHQEKTGQTYIAQVYEVPNAPFKIFWASPFGRLVELYAKPKTQRTFTPGHKWHIEYENMRRNHARNNARKEDATNEKKKWSTKSYISKKGQEAMVAVDKGLRKKNKDMSAQDRATAKQGGTEHLQRQQFDGLYGQLQSKDNEQNAAATSINRPSQPLTGFNNNQVLRIKR